MALIPNGRVLAIWNQGPYVQVSGPMSAFTKGIGQHTKKLPEFTTLWPFGIKTPMRRFLGL
ncbi:hypothetical protein CCE29_14720 [Lacticaseibacillus rhamnosus]|uniref:Uncharacterized protein n=2 Tax=Lacticaseibacillus rhamnosus TaxID=47715 RepID=A0AAX0K3J0_LACRH|nr:hypothetical protein B4583_05330 [Lacticaseibacillus rhamnosus]ASY47417.1 hypothetical protein N507_0222 [Lacticaseibacillus rhamnosus DSM 14870]AXI94402.1 hypothetical protein DU507_07790 [Lacticaseibacillus rhamnosus GG]ART97098.1 hypothetical protein CCE29_14720 [Lacticaseibacillus rhamnosus]AZZ23076.1 hypothetical protein CYG41_07770 [Lacticaseibacillus rhamnosus]